MNDNKKPITLLDILKNAKTRGAKTLKEAVNNPRLKHFVL